MKDLPFGCETVSSSVVKCVHRSCFPDDMKSHEKFHQNSSNSNKGKKVRFSEEHDDEVLPINMQRLNGNGNTLKKCTADGVGKVIQSQTRSKNNPMDSIKRITPVKNKLVLKLVNKSNGKCWRLRLRHVEPADQFQMVKVGVNRSVSMTNVSRTSVGTPIIRATIRPQPNPSTVPSGNDIRYSNYLHQPER